jgi:uncharacterized protein YjlB
MAAETPNIDIEEYRFEDDGSIPNSRIPVLVYRGAHPLGADLADRLEAIFERNDWSRGWRDGIYDYHHFHSTAHEVLGIARGEARIRLGGEHGRTVAVKAGDVMVLPAGTGHRNEGSSSGAYAGGRSWDICRGEPTQREQKLRNIRAVPLPTADPLHGAVGPLTQRWRG